MGDNKLAVLQLDLGGVERWEKADARISSRKSIVKGD